MAKAGYTTGGGGILLLIPTNITNSSVGIGTETTLPTSLEQAEKSNTKLSLAIYTSREDEVGLVSASPSFDASPKQITFVTDRDDQYTIRWMQRYCTTLRTGLESTAPAGASEKSYEDGLAVRKTEENTNDILPNDVIFFVWLGAPMTGESAGMRKIVYGLTGVAGSTPNYATANNTDNQYTITLTGAPQDIDATFDISNFVFPSAVDAHVGNLDAKGGGAQSVFDDITDGTIGQIFGNYIFNIPAKTSILQDIINI